MQERNCKECGKPMQYMNGVIESLTEEPFCVKVRNSRKPVPADFWFCQDCKRGFAKRRVTAKTG